MINHWQGLLQILGVIVWIIGALVSLEDYSDSHRGLKDFRKEFGKDLGLLLFILSIVLHVILWPPFLVLSFLFGLIRDVIRVFFPVKTVEPVKETTNDAVGSEL